MSASSAKQQEEQPEAATSVAAAADGEGDGSGGTATAAAASARAAAADAAVRTSNYVYVKSEDHAWVPARLLETDAATGEAAVSVPEYKDEQSIQSDGGRGAKRASRQQVRLDEYPNRALPLQNVDSEGNLRQVDDMVDLPFLHEVRCFSIGVGFCVFCFHQLGLTRRVVVLENAALT